MSRTVSCVGRLALAALALAGCARTPAMLAQPSGRRVARAVDVADLPLTVVPAVGADAGRTLLVLVSGDGGWAAGDRAVAQELAANGIAVVGLDARTYLRQARRTPDSAARDLARIFAHYGALWNRGRLALLGYSRGADLAPFLVTRLPAEQRRRLALVAMVGLAEPASFQFHWTDLVRDDARPSDLRVRPELERLRGMNLLCLYGRDEKGSLCPQLDPGLATVAVHAGGHHLTARAAPDVVRQVLAALNKGGSR